jgi:serine/threonine-protein kinase
MAPEAALGEQALDSRVDLYGLGCVAYWLLTGQKVFTGRTPVEVLLHHVKTPPVPPSQRASAVIPPALDALVLQCLAKDPEDRPPSAEWLAERLAAVETPEAWTPARARAWWESSRIGATRSSSPDGNTRTSTAPPTPRRPPEVPGGSPA